MNKYLADTTVIIEHLRGNEQARRFLEKYSPRISTVTVAELIQGSKNKQDLTLVIKLCKSFSEEVIDKKIPIKAIELLKEFHLSHGLVFLDALVAATALENKLVLITGNLKHFRFIKKLQVISQDTVFKE